LVIIVISVMSISILGYLQSLTSYVQTGAFYQKTQKALYISEAGIEDGLFELKEDQTWTSGISNKEFPLGSGNHYSVTVTNNYPVISLVSTGTEASGISQRIRIRAIMGTNRIARIDRWEQL